MHRYSSNSVSYRTTQLVLLLLLSLVLAATAYYCQQPQQRSTTNFGAAKANQNNNACVPWKLPTSSAVALMMASRSNSDRHRQADRNFSWTSSILSERSPKAGSLGSEHPRKKGLCRCPDDDDDMEDLSEEASLEDRREALFAAMGGAWALAGGMAGLGAFPGSASATAGVDANMAFPDVIGGMNDRATKQCLVESLGNRECLVYKETDPDKLLYKGIDGPTLVARIKKASSALTGIPPLVEKKKWNDVNGLLIGPMGELSSTLTMLSGGDVTKTKLARKVKEDLFAMGTANTQRQPDVILKYHAAATKDLAKFLEVAL